MKAIPGAYDRELRNAADAPTIGSAFEPLWIDRLGDAKHDKVMPVPIEGKHKHFFIALDPGEGNTSDFGFVSCVYQKRHDSHLHECSVRSLPCCVCMHVCVYVWLSVGYMWLRVGHVWLSVC